MTLWTLTTCWSLTSSAQKNDKPIKSWFQFFKRTSPPLIFNINTYLLACSSPLCLLQISQVQRNVLAVSYSGDRATEKQAESVSIQNGCHQVISSLDIKMDPHGINTTSEQTDVSEFEATDKENLHAKRSLRWTSFGSQFLQWWLS